MRSIQSFRFGGGIFLVVSMFACPAQTRRPQPAHAPVEAPPKPGAVLTPQESLRGLKRFSIDLDGWGSETAEMHDLFTKLLQGQGIEVLPDGSYPAVRLNYRADSADFSTGDISTPYYRQRTVRGVVITLAVAQLLPLGNDSVPAVTYRQMWSKVGFNLDTNAGTKQVVQQFMTDLVGDSRDGNDVLIKQSIGGTNRLEAYDGASEWSAEEKAQAHEQERDVFFGTPRPQALVCYYSAGMRFFWYKAAPANATSAFKAMPGGPLKNIGFRALDACPANLAAAKEAQKAVTK